MSKTLVTRETLQEGPDSEDELDNDADVEEASTSGKRNYNRQKTGPKKTKKFVKGNNGWDLVIERNEASNKEDISNKMQICGDIGAGIRGGKLVFFKQWKKDGEIVTRKPYPEFDIEAIDGLCMAINHLFKILNSKKK